MLVGIPEPASRRVDPLFKKFAGTQVSEARVRRELDGDGEALGESGRAEAWITADGDTVGLRGARAWVGVASAEEVVLLGSFVSEVWFGRDLVSISHFVV